MLNQDGCAPINLDFVTALVSVVGMDDANTDEDPITALILAYCPSAARPAWRWLWTLQKRINDGVARVGEPVLGQMRIAWWRDRILDADTLSAQHDPLLLELAALAQLHSDLPNLACRMLDGIEARITAENAAQRRAAIASEGQIMVEGFAALTEMPLRDTFGPIGRAFALSRAFVHGKVDSNARDELAAEIANSAMVSAGCGRLPRSLSIMRLYTAQVLAAPNHQLRRRDGLKIIIHSLTGWPNP